MDHGEIVAIIPRSFCNGTYFQPFREWLLKHVAIRHIHVFETRNKAFAADAVLQENVIVSLERSGRQDEVIISNSHDATFGDYAEKRIPFSRIVNTLDRQKFIHIPTSEVNVSEPLFCAELRDLDLQVSTGPVVDFRLRKHWVMNSDKRIKTVPLIYAHHFSGGSFKWPRKHNKKPNDLLLNDDTRKWLMPRGWYTVTKRFSAKEEKRRIVAYALDPKRLRNRLYGFENHLNVFHAAKNGLSPDMAYGLATFLNSTIVDEHFRSFSGHTQVNATDLRALRYPCRSDLLQIGKWARKQKQLTQERIDAFLAKFHKRQR